MAQPNVFQTIINAESGGRNVNNYMFDSKHTASGYFQITDTTWAGTTAGQNSGFTHAMDAPFSTQQAVAGELIQKNGLRDWAPYDHIDGNLSHYDTTPLSGPGGTPVAGSTVTAGQGAGSDASATLRNGDGTYTQSNGQPVNGTPTTSTGGNITKANPSQTPIAIATGADETAAATLKAGADASAAAKTLSQGLYSAAFAGAGDLISRVGLVAVGLVLLAGALYIIAAEHGAPVPGGSAVRRVGKTAFA